MARRLARYAIGSLTNDRGGAVPVATGSTSSAARPWTTVKRAFQQRSARERWRAGTAHDPSCAPGATPYARQGRHLPLDFPLSTIRERPWSDNRCILRVGTTRPGRECPDGGGVMNVGPVSGEGDAYSRSQYGVHGITHDDSYQGDILSCWSVHVQEQDFSNRRDGVRSIDRRCSDIVFRSSTRDSLGATALLH